MGSGHGLIGVVLIVMALGELGAALFVVPRIENPAKQQLLLGAFGLSALTMFALGALFLLGVF